MFLSVVLCIVFFCLSPVLRANDKEASHPIDSLEHKIKETQNVEERFDLYIHLINNLQDNGELDEAYRVLLQVGREFDLEKNIAFKIRWFDARGVIYRNQAHYTSAIMSLQKGVEMAEKRKESHLLPDLYNHLGVVYRRVDQYEKALEFHIKALEASREQEDETNVSKALNSIGNVNFYLNKYDEALQYFNEAIAIERKRGSQKGIAINLNNIGEIYQKQEMYDEAIELFIESKAINEKINNQYGIEVCCLSLGNTYKAMERYNEALSYYSQALQIGTADRRLAIETNINVGELYSLMGLEDKAQEHLNLALQAAIKKQLMTLVQLSYEKLFEHYIRTGNTDKALESHTRSHRYHDSLQESNSHRDIELMQAQFDTERKESHIQILKQEKERQYLTFVSIGITVLALALVIVIVFSTKTIKTKRKNNQELRQSLQEKELLISEIHHRVKNNLALISGLVQLQSINIEDGNTQKALDDLQHRIKAISLVYDSLYQSDTLAHCDMGELLRSLVRSIQNIHDEEEDVTIQLDLEQVILEPNSAIPLAIIFNELITNAFLHSLQDFAEGNLWVQMKREGEEIIGIVANNGKKLPENFNLETEKSLGLMLVKIYTQQLKGSIQISEISGYNTAFIVRFTPQKMRVWK